MEPTAQELPVVMPTPLSSAFIANPKMNHYHLHLHLISSSVVKSVPIIHYARPVVVAMAMATATTEVPPSAKVLIFDPALFSPMGL